MEYLKLQRSFRTTKTWLAASIAARGAWVCLAGYCADEENAGRIAGAQGWCSRMWMQLAGLEAHDVATAVAAGLATWEGEDLVVAGYDRIGEEAYQAKRKQAAQISAKGVAARAATRTGNPSGSPTPVTQTDAHAGNPRRNPDPDPILHSPSSSSQEETLPPPSPGETRAREAKPAAGGGAGKLVQALDPKQVAQAIDAGDLKALVLAFRADPKDWDGWLRETDGQRIGTVAHVFAMRWRLAERIRQPSGYRVARLEYENLGMDMARKVRLANAEAYGLPVHRADHEGRAAG